MWHFLTGVKPPPQKKAKLSETDARYEKEKRMQLNALRRQKWMFFLSSALKCVGFYTRQPRIHQGNQIHSFGCPAFEIGTTWILSTAACAIDAKKSAFTPIKN